MKNILDKKFLGSSLALMVGALFILGSLLTYNLGLTGLAIIFGALVYRSAKKRRLNLVGGTPLRIISEILGILVTAPVLFVQSYQTMFTLDLVVFLWALIAYVVIIPKPDFPAFRMAKQKPTEKWRWNNEALYSLVSLIAVPVSFYGLTNFVFWLTPRLSPPNFLWKICYKVTGDWPQCVYLLRESYYLVTKIIFNSALMVPAILVFASLYFAVKSVKKAGSGHPWWRLAGVLLCAVSGFLIFAVLVVVVRHLTGIDLLGWVN